MKTFFDQLDRELHLEKTPQRIVSLVPSQTELLVDLGLKNVIFGVTKFCVHPTDLKQQKEIVGGTKQVHTDRIAALEPDIILCNKEENTEEMVLELEKIAPVHVSDIKTIDDSLELIREYGEIFAVREKASEIVREIDKLRKDLQEFLEDKPYRKVAYLIWKKPYMAVGKDTFIDHLLSLNHFKNIFAEEDSRYPEISTEALSDAELVFLSTEPFPFKENDKEELENEVRKSGIHIVDGEFFSWYGSRLLAAFDYFKKLHSEVVS
jgi:iron complex transport system substrate-binding protein